MTAQRLNRRLFGLRLTFRLAGLTAAQVRARVAVLDKLEADAQVDVVRALHQRQITLAELVDLDRQGKLRGADIYGAMLLRRNLWDAVTATLPAMGRSDQTRLRYQVSLNALRERAGLDGAATIGDLRQVDWSALQAAWPASASDWNHVRRAVSRFLTLVLGDKWHPVRREVVARIATLKEHERTPDLTMSLFRDALQHVPEPFRPYYITIAAHGLRAGEYLSLTPGDLQEATSRMVVRGKTGQRTVPVHPEVWAYVAAAVPCPIGYSYLHHTWKRAVKAIGYPHITLHDLRHLAAQTASDGGAGVVGVMELLGHSNTVMAGRYAKQTDARRGSDAVARAFLRVVGNG